MTDNKSIDYITVKDNKPHREEIHYEIYFQQKMNPEKQQNIQ